MSNSSTTYGGESSSNTTFATGNATAATSLAALGSPFIFNGKFASPPSGAKSAQDYDHYVSFTMRANSLAPNYAYDLVNRGDLSDGTHWVYNMYMFGTSSSGLNGRIQVLGYNHVTHSWAELSPLSSPLSPLTNYSIVWQYSNIAGGELFVNNVSQGPATGGGTLDTSLSSAFHVGENMYNGGGRQHSAFYGTISNVYHFERDLAPVANFTGSPLSGTAPLNVTFTDTSTGSPTNWSWSFGDGNTSTNRNSSHTYTAAGTYDVSLTATNAGGSDTETKVEYVTVAAPQTTFYVYAEGVGMYHGTQDDLSMGNQTPGDFYNLINGQCGTVDTDKCWYGRGIYLDDNAGSVHWSTAEQASSYADNADFSVFVGHGWNDGIVFGTQNTALELSRTNMQLGGNQAKWVTFFACDVLNQSTQTNWESVFNGVHIVNGFDTHGLLYEGQGTKYAQMLTGLGGGYDRMKIRDAWRMTLQETINKEYIKGAYMWANPCGNDYLPGFGDYCTSSPTKDQNGNYDIEWENFECITS
ncbi:MAG: PKD domain-containing protein [Methanoregula sp.]|uniref:DUF6345 domain-containing protein n=1 Tax=Methanoregula sp. TaxID=2052170 RepID=UPI0025FA3336|nr:DUF6345 domain-containing protein [Methanoregula sp.]MCK9631897.1 PKD domain-containing protein [Methanoregula sp.]